MKTVNRSLSLMILCFTLVFSLFAYLLGNAPNKTYAKTDIKYASDVTSWYEVSTWEELKDALGVQGDENRSYIKLVSDIKEVSKDGSGSLWEAIPTTRIYGVKALDLNGHTLIAEDLSNRTKNGLGLGIEKSTNTMFELMPNSRLNVMDSVGGGKIRFLAGIPKRETSQVVAQYIAYAKRDIFSVSKDSTLVLDSGTIEAGESKKMWVTNLLSFDETGSMNSVHYTGYMHHVNWGTAVKVQEGGYFYMNSGRIEGAGQEQMIYGTKKAINDAAVEVENGGFVQINGGTVLGYAGADCMKAKSGAKVVVNGGSFITEKYDWNRGIESDEKRDFSDEFNLGNNSYYIQRVFEGEYGYIGIPSGAIDGRRVTIKQNNHDEGEYEGNTKYNLYVTPKNEGITKDSLKTLNSSTQSSNVINYVPNESLKLIYNYTPLYETVTFNAQYDIKFNFVVDEKKGNEWVRVSKYSIGDLSSSKGLSNFDLQDIYDGWVEGRSYRVGALYDEFYRCGDVNISTSQRSNNYILINTIKPLDVKAEWKVKPVIGKNAEITLDKAISDGIYTWKMAINNGTSVEWVVIATTNTPSYEFKSVEGKYSMLGRYVTCEISSKSMGGVITLNGVYLEKMSADQNSFKMPTVSVNEYTFKSIYATNLSPYQEYVVTDSPFEPSEEVWAFAKVKGAADNIAFSEYYSLDKTTLTYKKALMERFASNYFLHTRIKETSISKASSSSYVKFSTSNGYPVDFAFGQVADETRKIEMNGIESTVYYFYVPYGESITVPIYFSPTNSTHKNIGLSIDANASQTGSKLSFVEENSGLKIEGNAISGVDWYNIAYHESPTADRGERGWKTFPSTIAVITYVKDSGKPPYLCNYDNFENNEVIMEVGEMLDVTPYSRPYPANGNYSSMDPTIASFESNTSSWLKANKVGETEIKFGYTNTRREGETITLKVKVVESKTVATYDSDFKAHNLVSIGSPTEATCTEPSYQKYQCTDSGCSFSCMKEVSPALGHKGSQAHSKARLYSPYNENQIDDTCHWKVCSDCSAVYALEEHQVIDGVCSICGYEEMVECNHTSLTLINEVTPTSANYNHGFREHYECDECGKMFADNLGNLAINESNYYSFVLTSGSGHIYSDTDDKQLFSYNDYEHWQICIICGYVSVSNEPHDLSFKTKYAATCYEEGLEVEYCTICGYETGITNAIEMLDHTPSGVFTHYGENANHHDTCLICGTELIENDYDCVFGNWIIEIEPSCDYGGYRYRICEKCGFKDEEYNYEEPKGHSWLSSLNENCHWNECVFCGEIEYDISSGCYYIPHDMVIGYDEEGHYTYCSSCMYPYDPLDGPTKTPHSLYYNANEFEHGLQCEYCDYHGQMASHSIETASTETITKVCATCIDKEVTATITSCPDCGFIFSSSEEIGDFGTHSIVKVEEVSPTHSSFGVKEYYTCEICGSCYKELEGLNEIANIDSWKENEGKIDMLPTENDPSDDPGDNPGDNPTDPNNPDDNKKDDKKGLTGGAIAGIVISSLVVASLGGFAIIWFIVKKRTFADLIKIFKK